MIKKEIGKVKTNNNQEQAAINLPLIFDLEQDLTLKLPMKYIKLL